MGKKTKKGPICCVINLDKIKLCVLTINTNLCMNDDIPPND